MVAHKSSHAAPKLLGLVLFKGMEITGIRPIYRSQITQCQDDPFLGNSISTDRDYYSTLLGIKIDTDRQVMAWMYRNA